MTKSAIVKTLKEKPADFDYHPTKAETAVDISIPTTPERLATAVLKGGAKRRESDD